MYFDYCHEAATLITEFFINPVKPLGDALIESLTPAQDRISENQHL